MLVFGDEGTWQERTATDRLETVGDYVVDFCSWAKSERLPPPENWRSIWKWAIPKREVCHLPKPSFFCRTCSFLWVWFLSKIGRQFFAFKALESSFLVERIRFRWIEIVSFQPLLLYYPSMHSIFTYIYHHKDQPYVGKYTVRPMDPSWLIPFTWKAGRLFHWGDLGCDSLGGEPRGSWI